VPARARRVALLLALAAPALAVCLQGQAPAASREEGARWPTFTDVTAESGATFEHRASPTSEKYLLETMGSGVAMLDYDTDGRLDLYFVNGARLAPGMAADAVPVKDGPAFENRLYHQRPDRTFEDVTSRAGVAGNGYGMGVATGDYDNDGDTDLYVTAYPRNTLYRNNGDGTFGDVTAEAGVGASGWSTSAAFVDLDRDGRLDLVVARYLQWSFGTNPWCGDRGLNVRAYCHPDLFKGITPVVFRNEGGGRFSDVTSASGIARHEGKSLGVALTDYDRDGAVDPFIANDSVPEFLYRNTGDGRFEERALQAGAAVDEDGRTFAGMGVDAADFDNDGWPDVVVTTLSNQMYALFRNAGDGTFTYMTHRSGVGRVTILNAGWGIRFADLDNDGWKDLLVAQGHVLDTIEKTQPQVRYEQPPLALRNTGARTFEDVSAASGRPFSQPWAGRGLALGDLDNDGDLDAVVTVVNGAAHVLRNDGVPGAHWLALRLVGSAGNRDGIGATVRVVDAAGRQQWATATTSSSYLSAGDPRVHFGLGAATGVSLMEVRWPSGAVQRVEQPGIDRVFEVKE
jgi:hypothetical protein